MNQMKQSIKVTKTFFQVNIQDIRGKKKACEICKKDFSVLVKEHQCKRCKRAVCYACSQNKAPVYKINLFKQNPEVPHRQCLKCKAESERQRQFIADNKLIFGRDTISARWLQQLQNKLKYSELTKEYYDNLNDPQFDLKMNKEGTPEELTYKKYKEMDSNLEKLLAEYSEAFNYSFQEFFHFVINKTDPQTICSSIRNIIKAFLNKHPDYGFDNQFILIVMFFLCFSSEPVAFTLLSKFYDEVYPRQLYYKFIKQNNYDIQKYMQLILQLLENVYQVPPSTAQKTQSYLKHDFLRLAFSLTINALTFENTYMLIDNTIQSCNFMEFLKGVTALCSLKMEEIVKYADVSFEKLQVVLLRNVELQELTDALKLFELVDKKVQEKIIQFFQKEEEKEGFVLDDKYFQNKIVQSDQYKQLLFKYEQQIEEKEHILQDMRAKDYSYQELLREHENSVQALDELKNKYVALEQELFTYKNMPKQEIISTVMSSGEQEKKIAFLEARLAEVETKNALLTGELKEMDESRKLLISQQAELQVKYREANKLFTDLAFENQNLQYELDDKQGRSRASTRSRTQETPKLGYEILEEKVQKLTEQLEQMTAALDKEIIETSEMKMQRIRMSRQLSEHQHAEKSLQLHIALIEEQLAAEKSRHHMNVEKLQSQLQLQYRKLYESLEVAYNRNEALQKENDSIVAKDKMIREKLSDMNKLMKVLQEENEKLRLENEELNKIQQLAKKVDQDMGSYNQLLNIEDVEKQKLARELLTKVNDLLKEIEFRTIDQMLKREYINQLQRKNKVLQQEYEDQEKALKILAAKIEQCMAENQNTSNSPGVPQGSKGMQQSIANDVSFKSSRLAAAAAAQNGNKEECVIM